LNIKNKLGMHRYNVFKNESDTDTVIFDTCVFTAFVIFKCIGGETKRK